MPQNIKDVLVPVLVAMIVGSFSSYVATRVTLERVETKITYIEADLGSFKELLKVVSENQRELLVQGAWVSNTDKWKNKIEKRIDSVEETLRRKPY